MEKVLVHSQAESGVFPLTDPKLMRHRLCEQGKPQLLG